MSIDDYQARYQPYSGSTDKILLQSQPLVTGVFRPELIVIDDAAHASEADLWPVFANYDAQQPSLRRVRYLSLPASAHERMLLCMLDEQYRMASMLGDLVSQLFYQGRLRSPHPLPSTLQTMSGRIADLNHALFGALAPRGDDLWQLLPFMCWK
ncbi:hypothetical protein AKAW_05877 [Aspergillus luchuensis IFO 4308]|nr:hypothetical protein AKAW_05877 [Aspergillus luchuensis IFO 4308]